MVRSSVICNWGMLRLNESTVEAAAENEVGQDVETVTTSDQIVLSFAKRNA